MIGLADIPCLGKIVNSISNATAAALFRAMRYTFRYKALVNDLNSEIHTLNGEKQRVSMKVNDERDSGRIIYSNVLEWLETVEKMEKVENVDDIHNNANQISPSWRCIQCLPIPNPVARFQIGKEAVLKARDVTELADQGRGFQANKIGHLPPAENVPNTEGAFQIFPSRNDAYKKLWKDLVDKDGPVIVGIYGMAGVGKTRMMLQIWKEAKEQGIFNKVTLAVVGSQRFDVINLQTQIASHLGCHLESEDDRMLRANQLKNSLKNGDKVLIVLDDVWRAIPLEDIIGTGLGDDKIWKGYKILFTSRERSVCLDNKCMHPVEITALTGPEAWNQFENTIGMVEIESLNDKKLAEEVCHKCAGLPLVIHAVARALKSTTHNLWKDTLHRFQTNIESVRGIRGEVYSSLRLSFDKLEEDVKQCLLSCSLFPRNADIPMRKLIQFTTGSQPVSGGRTRILAMIDILKSSSMLLQGKDDEHLKLSDIIRDVAISVAVRDYAFLRAKCGSLFPDNAADYSRRQLLHLDVEKDDAQLPEELVCPELHTLLLQGQYEINIPKFSGSMFVNLRFLVLIRFFSQQQFSLRSLLTLKTLILDDCDLRNTNASFYPRRLETLCIWDCNLPTFLELPNLMHLRKLEILDRYRLQMGQRTISHLPRLKELYLEYPSENKDDSRRSIMPRLREISRLSCLTSLKIFWDSFDPSQDTTIFSSLLEYDIRVGGRSKNKYKPASKVSLTRLVELTDGNNFEGFHGLLGRAEEVTLRSTNVDINNIWNSGTKVFEDLRNLYIDRCYTMEHLVARKSQYEIQVVPPQQTSFSKLTILQITSCSAMKYLISKSVAKCLDQLQHLSIFGCNLMEVIITNEDTSDGGDSLIFPNLISLKLSDMDKLTRFFGEIKDARSSLISSKDNSTASSSQSQPLFDGMVAFPSLQVLEIKNLKETSDIWGNHYYTDNVLTFRQLKSLEVSSCHELETVIPLFMLHRLQNLECLIVDDCNGLGNVFLPSIARGLAHLKKLEVKFCKRMTEIIGAGERQEESTDIAKKKKEESTDIIVFSELTKLKLNSLPELNIFCLYQEVQFPNLVDLKLQDVKMNLEEIELGIYDSTCQLKYLDISCDNEIQLPYTWQQCLYNLERLALRPTWSEELKFMNFQNLKVLKVLKSGGSTLFTLSVLWNLQQLQELEISNCDLLEEVLEDVRGDETSGMNKEPFILSKMRKIVLTNLPKLKTFFGNYEFCMPVLEHVEVDNCGLFTTLFTYSVSKNLGKLQSLHVYNCRLLEGIVEDARGTETSYTYDNIIKLSELKEVVLTDLPNLKSFSLTVSLTFRMPELRNFRLFRCPRVENFNSLETSVLVAVNSEWHLPKKVSDLNDFARQYRKRCDRAEHQPLRAAFLSVPWSSPWAC